MNFFDAAIAYQSVTSEQYLGSALKDFTKREDVAVATKLLPRTTDEIEKECLYYVYRSSFGGIDVIQYVNNFGGVSNE